MRGGQRHLHALRLHRPRTSVGPSRGGDGGFGMEVVEKGMVMMVVVMGVEVGCGVECVSLERDDLMF